ncbi:uncharacterized protein CMU_041800 [Cryptosporidium muris RN66]|uniref:Acyltransferase 3 domain-containing protein n=1 Tax=Cryptosporidium muris (strain RN66) TaxID=441375 RepID=B6AA66_CRYMR|nr:uncharacterized protein CMU_041800 [Cryptosporidium muris RN66]EEA05107.1 hypothetical protein, conserved [Cryptosporidium muris RN66]|eukprot:XP_002139456.1 hypothetical protein [Cryptosporidium muris RN66]
MELKVLGESQSKYTYYNCKERLYDIDWLKIVAVWLVILVHVIQYLRILNINISETQIIISTRMIVFFLQFGMPIFFYSSGRVSFKPQNFNFYTFLKRKVLRLLVPLAIGYFTILPLTHYISFGRRPCVNYVDISKCSYFEYYIEYIKGFSCHGFEWLWFLSLLAITNILFYPFAVILANTNADLNIKNNDVGILTFVFCFLISICFGPIIAFCYDLNPIFAIGLSLPYIITVISSFVMRYSLIRKKELLYLTAISFILSTLIISFYGNIDNSSQRNNNLSNALRGTFSQITTYNKGINISFRRGILVNLDGRKMFLAIIYYIAFFAVGYIDGTIRYINSNEYSQIFYYQIESEKDKEKVNNIQDHNYQLLSYAKTQLKLSPVRSDLSIGIIASIPGSFRPFIIFISVALGILSLSLKFKNIGYMWSYPLYKDSQSAMLYVTGSWIFVFGLSLISEAYMNSEFNPTLYKHFIISSIIFYIVHMFWLEACISYLIIPYNIPFDYSIFIVFISVIGLCSLSYLLFTKVIGLCTLFGVSISLSDNK